MSNQPLGENPYAATNAEFVDAIDTGPSIVDGSGPPWEQPGPWPKRFFETMWLSYRQPNLMFGEMRRQGSWWMPVGYVVVSSVLFTLVQAMMSFGANSPNTGLFVVQSLAMALVNVPFVAMLAVAMQMLLALTGPRQPFRATLRSTFYALGSCFVVGLLGSIGQWLSAIVLIVLQVIAIKAVHRISELRAIGVVLGAWMLFVMAVIAVTATAVGYGVIPMPD